jgi:hypothetical protein
VPIAAKLLLQLKQPFVFTLLGKEHTLYLHLPFSWYLFYFSAVAFAVATALFGLFCPKIIKKYSSFGDFYGESSGARELLSHCWSLDAVELHGLLPVLYTESVASGGQRQQPTQPKDPDALLAELQKIVRTVKREEMSNLFSALRDSHDRRFPAVRMAILFFYTVGFVLITVALQNFAWVAKAVLR